ncbi:transglutaminase-like domain-containing protein [Anaerocellum danielii]|uniref:Transglutaminase-like domain-containing protein n=1 Tax=Anaerocellum danielii TaxID=1387557 RepID=A0ABZ0U2X2_9FIRM|nr:transglutaminase domain-containing protein [Caldicellulosiruptor danielii]WPX08804.1 hypothetical protein SOJ16_002714 [Caldicellulosiruptor danielii]
MAFILMLWQNNTSAYILKRDTRTVNSEDAGLIPIDEVVKRGWMVLANGVFQMDGYVTKGGIAVILSRVVGLDKKLKNPAKPTFTDVPKTHPYYRYIETMKDCLPYEETEKGLMLYPDKPITVQEAVYATIKATRFHPELWNIKRNKATLHTLEVVTNSQRNDFDLISDKYFPFMYIGIIYHLLDTISWGTREKQPDGTVKYVYTYRCNPHFYIERAALANMLYIITLPEVKSIDDVYELSIQSMKNAQNTFAFNYNQTVLSDITVIKYIETVFFYHSPMLGYYFEEAIPVTWKGPYMVKRTTDLTQNEIKKIYTTAQEIIIKIIKPGMNDVEKLKAIHDYLLKNVKVENYNSDSRVLNAYGPLVLGKSDPRGFAWAFQILAQMAGIPTITVRGGLGYMDWYWNKVYINGEIKNIDVAVDKNIFDGIPEFYQEGEQYKFFLVSDDMLEANDHTWDKKSLSENEKYLFRHMMFCQPVELK